MPKKSNNKVISQSLIIQGIILLLITLPAILPLLRTGFFPMYDDMQVIRLQQMDKCINDGQLPCRWVPDLGYGYGYPLFQYYAPLPYYLMEVFHFIGFSFIDAVKIGFIMSIYLSAVFIYLLAQKFFSKYASFVVAGLYVYLPMRAADLYSRGAMGELWGMATLPLVLWAFEYLLTNKSRLGVIVFAAAVALFLLSHNLTILMASVLVFGWIIIRLLAASDKKTSIIRTIMGGLLGIGLSAFFVLPMMFERHLVHLETMMQGYFNYLAHFLSVKQLFLSTRWGYGPSMLGADDDVFLGLGLLHLVVLLLGTVILFLKQIKNKYLYLFIVAYTLISLFLTHSRSTFVWEAVPLIQILQFPWRFILVAGFLTSFMAGLVIDNLKVKARFALIGVLLIWTSAIYLPQFKPKDWLSINDEVKLSGEMYQRAVTASIYDYLPKSASKAPDSAAPASIIAVSGQTLMENAEKGTDWLNYKVQVIGRDARIAFPVYDFPNWEIKVDNKRQEYSRFGDLGLPSITIPEGEHIIDIRLRRSLVRMLGDKISILSAVFIGVYLTYGYRKKKTA